VNVNAPGNYGSQAPPPKSGFPIWIVFLLGGAAFLVIVVPVLAVLAIYGVRKYIANAKTAEARNVVAEIGRDAVTAYEGDTKLCPSASRAVPASVLDVTGKKYQSTVGEWEADKATKSGFACLKFSMTSPQYYSYAYRAHGSSTPGDGFDAFATSDLAPSIVETNPVE
jgi:type IV pilus assembly protein PilA